MNVNQLKAKMSLYETLDVWHTELITDSAFDNVHCDAVVAAMTEAAWNILVVVDQSIKELDEETELELVRRTKNH